MGLLHQVQAYYTGGLAPSGYGGRNPSEASSDSSNNNSSSNQDNPEDAENYGTSVQRKVKRMMRRYGDKGNGR